MRPGRDYIELEVRGATDPEAILQAALARGERVTLFEIADPSIEQIFVERVGRSAHEDVSLAGIRRMRRPAPPAQAAGAPAGPPADRAAR